MKKNIRISIIIFILIISVTGCKGIVENDTEDENTDAEVIETDSNKNIDKVESKKIMDDFLDIINPDTSAMDIVDYIKNNIQYVEEESAETMIQWLLIYQTEIMDNFYDKIYEIGYLEALNDDMDGILDESKIDNIKDIEIRTQYENLYEGLLTIERYEEHPVVEMDWKRLKEFSPYVRDDFKKMINLCFKLQNDEYDIENLDVTGLAKDIIETENIFSENDSHYLRGKKDELYRNQIYALLIGPEGNNLEFWSDKDSEEYKEIISLEEKYPDSRLSQIIYDVNMTESEGMIDAYSVIDKEFAFGFNSENYIENVIFKKDNVDYNLIQLRMPNDREKENSINNIINEDIEEYIKYANLNEKFNLNTYRNFEDHQYISYVGFLDYYDSENNAKSIELYRTIDYIEEKFITLEDYLGYDFNKIKEDLKEISEKELETDPEFILNYEGLDIILNQGIEMYDLIHLNEKDLIPYKYKDKIIN